MASNSLEDWVADANDAFVINLAVVSRSGLELCGTFHPKFTYAIFGEQEKIIGYTDPKITLTFRANDMRPHLNVSYRKKFKSIGDTEPTDMKGLLREGGHLPAVAFVEGADLRDDLQQLGDHWTPPGELYRTILSSDGEYEIWKGSLADPAVKQLNNRIQILVPLFIEGGSYIGQKPEHDILEQDGMASNRWTLFFLYRKQEATTDATKSSYILTGFATVYRFFHFQPPTPPASPKGDWELPTGHFDLAELPCRTRLSQFIILPPFQSKGNGARLYNAIFENYYKHPQTYEFTVEDPNEAFDDLRDTCDLAFLRTIPNFANLHVNTEVTIPKTGPVPHIVRGGDELEAIRRKTKIAPRQFARVLEMHLMSQLPNSVRATMDLDGDVPAPTKSDKHHERLWQLFVKQRLYRHNKDVLSQIEPAERIEKLQETLNSVELEYARLLAAYERAQSHSLSVSAATGNRKRKIGNVAADVSTKKPRTGAA